MWGEAGFNRKLELTRAFIMFVAFVVYRSRIFSA